MTQFRLILLALLSAQPMLFPQLLKSQDASQDPIREDLHVDLSHNWQADRTHSSRRSGGEGLNAAVYFTLSDTADEVVRLSVDGPPAAHGSAENEKDGHVFPSYVSHDPGVPRKPHCERPGDIDQSACPPIRYCQDDCFRAGWPHAIRKWATCSVSSHYSAGYVGGGSPWILPHGRARTCEEGTWGLDYSLLSRPKMVWMSWTHGREQGGLGAYETDH